jgi:hypothetical protein
LNRELAWSLAVAGGCLLLYLWYSSTAITLADAGLFQMICQDNGIAHPPGYPLATVLCHGFLHIPLPGALPGNLFSIAFAVLTLLALVPLASLLGLHRLQALCAAMLLAMAQSFFAQAIVIEVYTLNTFVFVVQCYGVLRYLRGGGERWLLLAAFTFALGLSNHWPLILLSSVALVPFIFSEFDRVRSVVSNWRLLIQVAVTLLLGLSPYLLILNKSGTSMAMLGDVGSWQELFRYVSRSTYGDSFIDQQTRSFNYLWWLPLASFKQFTLVGMILIPIGMVRAVFVLRRDVMLFLLLLWGLNVLLLPLLSNYSFDETLRQYYISWTLLGLVSCAVWIVLALEFLIAQFRVNEMTHQSALVAGVVLLTGINLVSASRTDAEWVEEYNRLLLSSLKEDAVLFVAGDGQMGPLGYLHHVQSIREDVELRNQHGILFSNRLLSPFAPEVAHQRAVADFIDTSDRPVYTVSSLDRPAIDNGMYYELADTSGFAENADLDEFMSRLGPVLASSEIRDSFIRFYLDTKYYEYARSVIGMAIVNPVGGPAFQDKLRRVSATLQGKIWTLHHMVNSPNMIDKAQLLSLVAAGEAQINEDTVERAAGSFLRLAGDAYMLAPADPEGALIRYQWARAYDVADETCKHIRGREGDVATILPGCGVIDD